MTIMTNVCSINTVCLPDKKVGVIDLNSVQEVFAEHLTLWGNWGPCYGVSACYSSARFYFKCVAPSSLPEMMP